MKKDTKKIVVVDATIYRQCHGASPRGVGNWSFVMGQLGYDRVDEVDDEGRKVVWSAPSQLTFGEAKKLAVAEAVRRGVALVGVAP